MKLSVTLSTLIAAAHETLPTPAQQGALVAAGANGTFDQALAYLHRQMVDQPSPALRAAAEAAADALRHAYWAAVAASLSA